MNTSTTQLPPLQQTAPIQNQVIQVGTVEWLIGVAVLLIGLGVAWGTITTKISNISSRLKDNIEPDLKDAREKLFALEGKFSGAFASSSPIALLEKGEGLFQRIPYN